jgi:antitoxin Xre/MbcA/ParS-like protein
MLRVASSVLLLTPEARTGLVVRAAIRVFRDGLKAADWLGAPNTDLAGRTPLLVAKESEGGCRAVCAVLEDLGKRVSAPPANCVAPPGDRSAVVGA